MQACSERKSFPVLTTYAQNSPNMEQMENCERWWIQQRMVLPSRGTSTEWRNWLKGTSQNSTTGSTKLSTRGRIILYTCTCWGLVDRLEGSFAEKALGLQVDNNLNTSQQHAVVAKKADGILGCTRRKSAGQRRWSFPSVQHWWGSTWSAASGSGLPTTRAVKNYKRVHLAKGHQDD